MCRVKTASSAATHEHIAGNYNSSMPQTCALQSTEVLMLSAHPQCGWLDSTAQNSSMVW